MTSIGKYADEPAIAIPGKPNVLRPPGNREITAVARAVKCTVTVTPTLGKVALSTESLATIAAIEERFRR